MLSLYVAHKLLFVKRLFWPEVALKAGELGLRLAWGR
jgi:hypothetical protein